MIFVTVNDAPGGVYKSQVIEVINYINSLEPKKARLISFVSIRGYRKNKKTIKKWMPDALVIPMIPGLKFWRINVLLLLFVKKIRSETIVARNPMAFWISFRLNKNCIYDGRGAISSELEEYPDIIQNQRIINSICKAEQEAVLQSIYRIAVSQKLVEYWNERFQYKGSAHAVIPCTVSYKTLPSESDVFTLRQKLGFTKTDIILIYSGGLSGWQSFDLLNKVSEKSLMNPAVKIIFLSPPSPLLQDIIDRFPEQTKQVWTKPELVHEFLCAGDYGLLIRENTETNRTASPVKFGEYLNAGLKILISENIGDFSELTVQKELGYIFNNTLQELSPVPYSEKLKLNQFAKDFLSKSAFEPAYKLLMNLKHIH